MALRVACPGCKAVLSAPDAASGKSAKCPKCGQVVRIPPAPPTTPTPETKSCPRCGGAILAVAKKCKHCKSWLTPHVPDQTETSGAPSLSIAAGSPPGAIATQLVSLFASQCPLLDGEEVFFLNGTCSTPPPTIKMLLPPKYNLLVTNQRICALALHKDGNTFRQEFPIAALKFADIARGAISTDLELVFGWEQESMVKFNFTKAVRPEILDAVVTFLGQCKGGFEVPATVTTGDMIDKARKEGRHFTAKLVSAPFNARPGGPITLLLQDDRISILDGKVERFAIRYASIQSLQVETAERIGLMRTAAGYMLGGVLGGALGAFGFKKKDRFLKIDFAEEPGGSSQLIVGKLFYEVEQIKGAIAEARRRCGITDVQGVGVAQKRAAAEKTDDIAHQIEQLGHLREKGLLTEEEFQAKKSELLSRL